MSRGETQGNHRAQHSSLWDPRIHCYQSSIRTVVTTLWQDWISKVAYLCFIIHGQDDPLLWSHNERDGISNHQPHHCLLNRLFRGRSKKTWKLRITGLCVGNSPVTGEFPAQMASNGKNVSIWCSHHALMTVTSMIPWALFQYEYHLSRHRDCHYRYQTIFS